MRRTLGWTVGWMVWVSLAGAGRGAAAPCPGPLSSIKTVCDSLAKLPFAPFSCAPATIKDACTVRNDVIFTGATIEFASPQNIKVWNGRGGAGRELALAGVCALRDVESPEVRAKAVAGTLAGDISFEQTLGVLQFTPGQKPTLRAIQRGRLCAPMIGCLTAITQEFAAAMVEEPAPAGRFAGQYEIRRLHGIGIASEAMNQSVDLRGPAIPIPAGALGTLTAQPSISIGRQVNPITAPFAAGNTQRSLPVGKPNATVSDAVGLSQGLQATAAKPQLFSTGWIGQLALGGRGVPTSGNFWKPPAGVPFPSRPDDSLHDARVDREAAPNVSAEARLDIFWDLIDNWPPATSLKPVLTSDSQLSVTLTPALGVRGWLQSDLWNSEIAQWSSVTEIPPPVPALTDLDQRRRLEVYGGASVAGSFTVDLKVKLLLELDLLTTVELVDFEEKLRLLDIEAAGGTITKEWTRRAAVAAQATEILKGKAFTEYTTLTGSTDALAHLKACTSGPPVPAHAPPPVDWVPGNPEDLAKELRTPCNICLAWEGFTGTTKAGAKVPIAPFGPAVVLPVPQGSQPANLRWVCDSPAKEGCFDICRIEPKGLVLQQTAVALVASGGRKGCNAPPPPDIH